MRRTLAACLAAALLAGCQARNPYAAFGPATIPPPGMQAPAPYYPAAYPAAGAAGTSSAAGSANSAIPAAADPLGSAPPARFAVDASDAQPIRIVENPAPIRTATAPTATSGAGAFENAPGSQPAGAPSSPPPLNRMRGDAAPQTASGAVVPASYVQPSGLSAPTATSGGWRAR